MDTLIYTLSMLCAAAGLIGSIVRGVPSLFMSVIALALLQLNTTPPLTVAELFIVAGVACVATLSARYLSPIITRRWGGSKSGYCGAVIGMLAGFMLYPPTGVVLAPLFFAVMGEMIRDRSDIGRVFSQGFAAFAAFMVGAWFQFIVALWVVWVVVNSVDDPWWSRVESLLSF